MTSDVLLQKKAAIERCIKQARTYYAMPSDKPFTDVFSLIRLISPQDAK